MKKEWCLEVVMLVVMKLLLVVVLVVFVCLGEAKGVEIPTVYFFLWKSTGKSLPPLCCFDVLMF